MARGPNKIFGRPQQRGISQATIQPTLWHYKAPDNTALCGYDELGETIHLTDNRERVNCPNCIIELGRMEGRVRPVDGVESAQLSIRPSQEDILFIDSGSTTINALNIETYAFVVYDKDGEEVLKISNEGEFYVHGKLIDAEKELVDALRKFLAKEGHYKGNKHLVKRGKVKGTRARLQPGDELHE